MLAYVRMKVGCLAKTGFGIEFLKVEVEVLNSEVVLEIAYVRNRKRFLYSSFAFWLARYHLPS